MRNPVLFAAGLLGLAVLLPFSPIDWPAVAPITVAIGGAIVVWCRSAPPTPAPQRLPPAEEQRLRVVA